MTDFPPESPVPDMARRIMREGPSRVLLDADGTAVPPHQAVDQAQSLDVILIRNDGWSLAAPSHLAAVAHRLWADSWLAFLKRPDMRPRPMTDWRQP
jgi:hypothetical protein